jgi:hypothetical protein
MTIHEQALEKLARRQAWEANQLAKRDASHQKPPVAQIPQPSPPPAVQLKHAPALLNEVLGWLDKVQDEWTGTAAELLDILIEGNDRARRLLRSPRKLADMLADLEESHPERVERGRVKTARWWVIKRR